MSVDLRPINILIGENGSGKSNFLGVFSFLREIAAGRLWDYVRRTAGGAERILHFGSKATEKINIHVSFDFPNPIAASSYELTLAPPSYDLALAPTADDGLFPSREVIHLGPYPQSLSEWQLGREAGIGNPDVEPELLMKGLRQDLALWQVYHLHDTSYIYKTAKINDNRFLRANASNLPAFLYFLRHSWADDYKLIVRVVRRVAPYFDDFDLNPMQGAPDDIQLGWRHKGSDEYFHASALSDGTLRFMALATLLLQPPQLRRSLMLIDEPELGLHPYAVGLLAALIKQAAVDTQLIVSTQSSALLDNFAPEDVLVAERFEGSTQLTRESSERLKIWLEDYSLGQLWEKNELGRQLVSG